MAYDVDAVRAHFPALREGAAHFDGPGGSQTPDVVAEAIATAMTSALSIRGAVTRAERRSEEIVQGARAAMGDFLGVDPQGVVFGRSATDLTFHLARTLSDAWGPGDEVVVSRLDHDANIRPWVIAAERAGATVRWVDFDPATGELAPEAVGAILTERTVLVAVTAASNLIGTRPDVRAIADLAHGAGALVWIDGVHASAHVRTDLASSGADFWVCSPYKFLGPHLGVLGASPDRLESLRPDKLLPSPDTVPERFELGTLPYESLAGVTAAVDFLAGLADLGEAATSHADARGGAASADRAERLTRSFAALEEHEQALLARLEAGLRDVDGLTTYSRAARRTPTLLLTLDGHDPQGVRRALASRGVNAPAGHFYAWEASHHLGLGTVGGVRAGLAPYTSAADVDRLVAGIYEVARSAG